MQILLVRLRLIGDVVFTTPAIRALRRRFPDARLTYLVEEAAAPVVHGNPHLDEVVAIPRTRGVARLREDLRIGRALRARRFDVVIDFHGGPRASWLTWMTGAPRRIGYTVAGRSWMYTTAVARPRELRPRHSVENQWDLLATLGLPAPDPARDALEMVEDAQARAEVDRRLATAGVRDGEPIVVMHVSAGNPFRRWPVESFAAVAAGLVTRDPARAVVLTSGPSERQAAVAAGELARRQPGTPGARILQIGEVSLTELRALVGRAALYIGGDSGPLHVAGTTTTPVVGLFGPTLAVRSMPWRHPGLAAEAVEPGPLACRPCDQRRCVTGDFRCLTGTSPERVMEAAERLLARGTQG
jgi:lipopolysaccharide heptosyltransferase II